MKLLLLLFLCLLSPPGARAQLAIYNFTAVQNVTGSGTEATLRISGVFVVDLANARAYRLGRARINGVKRLLAGEEANFTPWRVQNRTGTSSLVVTGDITTGTNLYQEVLMAYTGRDSFQDIGLGGVWIPRTVKGAGHALIDTGGQFSVAMSTMAASHTFSKKPTIAANQSNYTFEQMVEQLRQQYLAAGWQP